MNKANPDFFEQSIQALALRFIYPPAPDLASQFRTGRQPRPLQPPGSRKALYLRLAIGMLLILTFMASLLAVPPVRAQILEFLQVGAIRVFFGESTPTPQEDAGSAPAATAVSTPRFRTPTPIPLLSLDLIDETTLDIARQNAGFELRLPNYPPGASSPEHVYLLEADGHVVIMVWMDPQDPEKPLFSLYQLGPNVFGGKKEGQNFRETKVNDIPAIWVAEAHPFSLQSANTGQTVIQGVSDSILLWTQDGITYRLETDLGMEEAVKIAESLK